MNRKIKNQFVNIQKGIAVALYIVCVLLFMAVSCGKQSNNEYYNTGVLCSFFGSSFLDGVSYTSKNNNIYVIEGIVSDAYKNGRKIKLVKDLKGNIPKSVATFNVWHNINGYIEDDRLDCISCYDYQDTLILLLAPEKPKGYTTLTCIYSILKLSNSYVTGNIIPWDERLERWGMGKMTKEEMILYYHSLPDEEQKLFTSIDTMPWDELQKRINNQLNR